MTSQGGWHEGELLGFDLETTGVDRFSDVPVQYALVTAVGGAVVRREAALVDPGRPIPEPATKVHGITTARARAEGRPLAEVVPLLASALVEASSRGVPVVGMKLDYDLTILDVQCRRLDGRGLAERGFRGPVVDALVLDRHVDRYRKGSRTLANLCAHYRVPIDNAHDASADAEATVGVLVEMCQHYPELVGMTLDDLHRAQEGWHRTWAASYDDWRQGRGMAPMDPRDYDWPYAAATPAGAPGGEAAG